MAIAVFSGNFYLDIHQAFYNFRFDDGLSLRLYGRQEDLPNEEDINPSLQIKSGDSFDVGVKLRKVFQNHYADLDVGSDVTITHNGLMGQLSTGLTRSVNRATLMFEVGAKFEDNKRSNY